MDILELTTAASSVKQAILTTLGGTNAEDVRTAVGTINVKDFGAVGDGVTDDWLAIQRALAYAAGWDGRTIDGTHYPDARHLTLTDYRDTSLLYMSPIHDLPILIYPDIWGTGTHAYRVAKKRVVFPAGSYRISKAIVVGWGTQMGGLGASYDTVIEPSANAAYNAIETFEHWVSRERLAWRCNPDPVVGYKASYANDIHISKLHVRPQFNVQGSTTRTAYAVTTPDHTFTGTAGTPTIYGFSNNEIPRGTFVRFRNHTTGAISGEYEVDYHAGISLHLKTNLLESHTNDHILHCLPSNIGILTAGGENSTIEDCMIEWFGGAGIMTLGGSPAPMIRNCMCTANKIGYWIDTNDALLLHPSGDSNEVFLRSGWINYCNTTIISPKIETSEKSRAIFQFGSFNISDGCQYNVLGGTVSVGDAFPWQPNHAYAAGSMVIPTSPNGRRYICVTPGISGATEPVWPVTNPNWLVGAAEEAGLLTVTDNLTGWKDQGARNVIQTQEPGVNDGVRAAVNCIGFRSNDFGQDFIARYSSTTGTQTEATTHSAAADSTSIVVSSPTPVTLDAGAPTRMTGLPANQVFRLPKSFNFLGQFEAGKRIESYNAGTLLDAGSGHMISPATWAVDRTDSGKYVIRLTCPYHGMLANDFVAFVSGYNPFSAAPDNGVTVTGQGTYRVLATGGDNPSYPSWFEIKVDSYSGTPKPIAFFPQKWLKMHVMTKGVHEFQTPGTVGQVDDNYAVERLLDHDGTVLRATTVAAAGVAGSWTSGSLSFGGTLAAPKTTIAPGASAYTYQSPQAAGTLALTSDSQGRPKALFDGTISGTLTINSTLIALGTGVASALMTALGAASDSTVVHLAGTEIVTGDKTLSGTTTFSSTVICNGNVSLNGQTTVTGASAMNRDMCDDRYRFNVTSGVSFNEDFMAGTNSNQLWGELGWNITWVGGTATFSYSQSYPDHPGVVSINTDSGASTGGMMYLSGNGSDTYAIPRLDSGGDWYMCFIFYVNAATNIRLYVGANNEYNSTTAQGSQQACFRYDTSLGDTTWKFECRRAGASTVHDTGKTAEALKWVKLEARCVTGAVSVRANHGSWSTPSSANTPAAGTYATLKLFNTTTASRSVNIDAFMFAQKLGNRFDS